MIQLQNISVIFAKNTPLENIALENINLKIAAGDFITLIGGNGAGKSTLLNVIGGEIDPAKGKIFFDAENVTNLPVEKRASFIGHVYQDPRLGTCESLTIEENLALAARRGKKPGLGFALNKTLRERFRNLLVDLKLGLEDRLNEQVTRLSGGQRQALSLIMATLQSPKILLLDEHTAALDPKTAKTILTITERIVGKHQLTTIMITHHMAHALELGNRTLLMQEGKIIQDLYGEERSKLKPENLIEYF